jgi:hypothetical protein
MKAIAVEEFLNWASCHGIGVDPEYAKNWPRNLSFSTADADWRYWVIPENSHGIVRLLQALVEGLGQWQSIYLWPKSTSWLDEIQEDDNPVGRFAANSLKGISDGREALLFNRDESETLYTLAFCVAAFGWSWVSDIYLVPDSGDVVLMIDHHQAVWAKFQSKPRCDAYVESLRLAGFDFNQTSDGRSGMPWMKTS